MLMSIFLSVSLTTLTFQNGWCGSLEQFKSNVCYHGYGDLDIYGIKYEKCLDECRARVTCTAVTMNRIVHHCRLHLGNDIKQVICPAHGFLYSEKQSWSRKQEDNCQCKPGHTCKTDTGACNITECPPPEPVKRGIYRGNQRYISAKILYFCVKGSIMIATTRSSECLASGAWSLSGDTLPLCVLECANTAPTGTNTVDPAVVSRLPGTVITYTCISWYIPLNGMTMNLTCSNDGSWGNPPTCVLEPCDSGWTRVTGRCRRFIAVQATWQDSQTFCESVGGNLAHIYSLQDIVNIQPLITCSFGVSGCYPWVGIDDIEVEGVFRSSVGGTILGEVRTQLVPYYHGEEDGSDCAYFDTDSYKLRLYRCNIRDTSICEK